MRGAAEPAWRFFYDEYDDWDAMMDHEDAPELMEAQLGSRLGAHIQVIF